MDNTTLEQWEKNRKKIIERSDINKEDMIRAIFHSFSNPDGSFYMPSDHVLGALINAGNYMKAKVGNSRKSMANIVAAMFSVSPEKIAIPAFDEVDKRSAVNRNIKGRIIVIRPKWNEWQITFTLDIDDDTLTNETILSLLNYAGRYVGLGSFRPEHRGHFGRFSVVKFVSMENGHAIEPGEAIKKKREVEVS